MGSHTIAERQMTNDERPAEMEAGCAVGGVCCGTHDLAVDHGIFSKGTMMARLIMVELEEEGGVLPIPNSFPQTQENQDFNYVFLGTNIDPTAPILQGRWSQGPFIDGKGTFTSQRAEPLGQEPQLGAPRPDGFAQTQQMQPQGLIGKVIDKLT